MTGPKATPTPKAHRKCNLAFLASAVPQPDRRPPPPRTQLNQQPLFSAFFVLTPPKDTVMDRMAAPALGVLTERGLIPPFTVAQPQRLLRPLATKTENAETLSEGSHSVVPRLGDAVQGAAKTADGPDLCGILYHGASAERIAHRGS